jgi:hypothetical protein
MSDGAALRATATSPSTCTTDNSGQSFALLLNKFRTAMLNAALCGTAHGSRAPSTIARHCVREVASAPPASLGYGRGIWNQEGIRRCDTFPESTVYCVLAIGISRGTSSRALWQIGVGRHPGGVFSVEKCERLTVPLPCIRMGDASFSPARCSVAIPLYSILTHRFHIRHQTFDWFSSTELAEENERRRHDGRPYQTRRRRRWV